MKSKKEKIAEFLDAPLTAEEICHCKDAKELVIENLALTKQILSEVEYIKKYIRWQKIFAIVKFLFIIILVVAPLVLSIFYMPQIINATQGIVSKNIPTSTLELLKNIK